MLKLNQIGYYDLNVQESCFQSDVCEFTLETLFKLGYRTIAVNQVVDVDANANNDTKKKKKKGESRDIVECVPPPVDLTKINEKIKSLGFENVSVINRLTIIFSSQDTLQKYVKSINYKKYDILGVIPTTVQALGFVCGTLEADILSFDPENKFGLKLNRKTYTQLVDKGYHMELTYGPAIQDSSKRKNLIHLSHLYHTFGKSKNIIFSSGAENPMLFRSPYDIISLGFLFGLSALQSKNSILFHPRKVTLNALGRRHGKSIMIVENIESMETTEPILIDSDDGGEEMDTDEPAHKKAKQ